VMFASPAVLVLGGEGKGLHEQVRKRCDALVRIPVAGRIASLNVSVAAGIVLFEWKRRHAR
jgi:23S rRNA (guanosine2251-2'-O)-methyltransferase